MSNITSQKRLRESPSPPRGGRARTSSTTIQPSISELDPSVSRATASAVAQPAGAAQSGLRAPNAGRRPQSSFPPSYPAVASSLVTQSPSRTPNRASPCPAMLSIPPSTSNQTSTSSHAVLSLNLSPFSIEGIQASSLSHPDMLLSLPSSSNREPTSSRPVASSVPTSSCSPPGVSSSPIIRPVPSRLPNASLAPRSSTTLSQGMLRLRSDPLPLSTPTQKRRAATERAASEEAAIGRAASTQATRYEGRSLDCSFENHLMLLEEIGDIDDMVKEVLRDLERLDEGRKLSNPRYRDLTPGQARRVAFTRLADAKRKIDERERAIQRMGCFTFSFGDARYAKDRLSRDFLVYPGTGRPSGSESLNPPEHHQVPSASLSRHHRPNSAFTPWSSQDTIAPGARNEKRDDPGGSSGAGATREAAVTLGALTVGEVEDMIKIYYTRTERRDASGRLIDDGSTKKTADTRGLITTRQIYDAKRKRLAKLAKSEEERRRVSFGRV